MQTFHVNVREDQKLILARNKHAHIHDHFEVVDDNTIRSKVTKIEYAKVDKFAEVQEKKFALSRIKARLIASRAFCDNSI